MHTFASSGKTAREYKDIGYMSAVSDKEEKAHQSVTRKKMLSSQWQGRKR